MTRAVLRCCLLTMTLALMGATPGCWDESGAQTATEDRAFVFAGIPPVAGFVERIGGEHVRVQSLLGGGQSPHTFEPTPKLLVDVQHAQLLIEVGLPFERQLVKRIEKTAPHLRIFNAADGILLRTLAAHEAHPGHDHSECKHDAGELDPHVWMSPANAKQMVNAIFGALVELEPEHRAAFVANRDALLRDLDALDRELTVLLEPYHGRSFYVFHPAYGYFAQAYGLTQMAIESGGKPPTARELRALVARAKNDQVSVLLVQPQMDKRTALALAREIGATVVAADPLARDYIAAVRGLAQAIDGGIKPVEKSHAGAQSVASTDAKGTP